MTHSTDNVIFRDAAGQIDFARYRSIANHERAKQMRQFFSALVKAFRLFRNGSSEPHRGEMSKGRWA